MPIRTPATAAIADAMPAASIPIRRGFTPNAAAISRSYASARSALPKYVGADEERRDGEGEAAPSAMSCGTGKAMSPTNTARDAYGFSSASIWRKSALQMLLISRIAMMKSPKLSRSESNSSTSKRSITHWTATPRTNMAGTRISTASNGSAPVEVVNCM